MPSSLNGTGVTFNDATTLQTGIIPAGNLASNSVTAVKIADANVTTAKLATNERMTTANVLSATAGASAGAVGTYGFFTTRASPKPQFGETVAGSDLRPSNAGGTSQVVTISGTWRAVGRFTGTRTNFTGIGETSLVLRIS